MPRASTQRVDASNLKQTIERCRTEKRERHFRVDDAPGLWLRISRAGTASWALVYTLPGQGAVKRYSLGQYPGVKLDAATAAANEWRLTIGEGIDPHQAKADAIADRKAAVERAEAEVLAKAARISIQDAVAAFVVAKADRRSVGNMRLMLTNELVSRHGKLALADLTEDHVRAIHRTIAARGTRHADNVLQVMKSFISWSLSEKLITKHIAIGIKKRKSGKSSTRERKLTAAELRLLWLATEAPDKKLSIDMRRIIKLAILLGSRATEIAGARKAEFAPDLMIWTIPGERMKAGVEHTLPLPPMAREIIREAIGDARGVHLFSARQGEPFRSSSVAHVMMQLRPKLLVAADKEAAGKAQVPFRDADGKPSAVGMHDLRRTLATGLQRLGVGLDVIGAVLAHSKSGITQAHYAQSTLLDEAREALTRWQAAVTSMVRGKDPMASRAEHVAEMERRILGQDLAVSTKAPSAPNVVPMKGAA